jgi:hypothetical protein
MDIEIECSPFARDAEIGHVVSLVEQTKCRVNRQHHGVFHVSPDTKRLLDLCFAITRFVPSAETLTLLRHADKLRQEQLRQNDQLVVSQENRQSTLRCLRAKWFDAALRAFLKFRKSSLQLERGCDREYKAESPVPPLWYY